MPVNEVLVLEDVVVLGEMLGRVSMWYLAEEEECVALVLNVF